MTDVTPPREFRFSLDAQRVQDLKERLRATRWPSDLAQPPGGDWEHGVPPDYLRSLLHYWAEGFDWQQAEAFFNRFAQYTLLIEGLEVHFIHVRSPHPEATPLLLMHGWPGSMLEFWEALPRLVRPEEFGGGSADAFHVVCPSLPGYGFSAAAQSRGMNPRAIGKRHDRLMQLLGYRRYLVQGGDWGALIARRMPDVCPESLIGVHYNLVLPTPPPGNPNPDSLLDDGERSQLEQARARDWSISGYSHIQGTKPQTLAYGLTDSRGLAAWIAEKFFTWSDHGEWFLEGSGRDWLLCNVSLYWMTGSIGSSIRLYREFFDACAAGDLPRAPCPVPTGIADYPKEIWRSPRPWAEREFNLVHWFAAPRGGHFPALEEPQLFVDDLRNFKRVVVG